MENKNLTAVDFIKEQLSKNEDIRWRGSDIDSIYKQAKQMEKEQIENAYVEGFMNSAEGWNGEYGIMDFSNIKEEISSEKYYNETYGK